MTNDAEKAMLDTYCTHEHTYRGLMWLNDRKSIKERLGRFQDHFQGLFACKIQLFQYLVFVSEY